MSSSQFHLAYTVCTPDCKAAAPLAYAAPFETALAELAELGYDGVEFQTRDVRALDTAAVTRAVRDNGLAVVAIATGPMTSDDHLTMTDSDRARRAETAARFRAAVELAAEFDALVTIGRTRGRFPTGSTNAEGRWAWEILTEVAEHARNSNVRLVLEPQNRYEIGEFITSIADALSYARSLGDNVGVLADTFHMNIEEQSLEAGLVQAGDRLWHVQFGDSNRWPPGGGHVNFTTLLWTMRAIGYDGWITMEHLQYPNSRRAAAHSAAMVSLAMDNHH